MADLEWSLQGSVGTITLNRPEQRNAFTFGMVREWAELLRDVRTDDAVRVVVLTGAGDKAFCSGIDLGSISNAHASLTPLERKSQLHDEIHQVALALEALDKPVIASINGAAVGAGLDMALMCDLRIAGPVGAPLGGLHQGRAHARRRRRLLPAPAGGHGQGARAPAHRRHDRR